MSDSEKDKLPNIIKIYPRLSDFFVDFFGALIPGTIFVSILVFLLVDYTYIIITILDYYIYKNHPVSIEQLTKIPEVSNYIYLILFIFYIFISYTFGFIFLRFGPRKPDKESFKLFLKREIKNKFINYILEIYSEKTIDDNTTMKERLVAINKTYNKLFWPYAHLHHYLKDSVPIIAEMVNWGVINGVKKQNPNRTQINAIKEAIQFHYPEQYVTLSRHEGQVRFLSSIWYVCKNLKLLSFIGGIANIILLLLDIKYNIFNGLDQPIIKISLVLNLMIYAISHYIKLSIEDNFHFIRVREITSILTMTYQARKLDPNFCEEFVSS